MASAPATSYFGSSGAFNNWSDNANSRLSGGFFTIDPAPKSTMATMLDGTSNIIAVGEHSYRIWTGGMWLGVQQNTQGTTTPGTDQACCQDWFLTYSVYPITNTFRIGLTQQTVRWSSDHAGGAQFLLADGSVRFISENIDHILDTTNADPAHLPAQGAGCLWRDNGCNDNVNAGSPFHDKALLATRMGLFQRLFHKSDGLTVGEF
jgi:prepilin-type processing-associated H-X9-DG protein